MEHDLIDDHIYRAIRTVKPSLSVVPITPDTNFDNLGLSSLEMTTVVFEIEDALGVSIVDQNLDTFRTVREARQVVERLLRKTSSAAPRAADVA
jgi:acyl carrier protein